MMQVNSVVMDGHVSKEERLALWNSSHRRIIFATPQAFKNDVSKGQLLHLSPHSSSLRPGTLPSTLRPLTRISARARKLMLDSEIICALSTELRP